MINVHNDATDQEKQPTQRKRATLNSFGNGVICKKQRKNDDNERDRRNLEQGGVKANGLGVKLRERTIHYIAKSLSYYGNKTKQRTEMETKKRNGNSRMITQEHSVYILYT